MKTDVKQRNLSLFYDTDCFFIAVFSLLYVLSRFTHMVGLVLIASRLAALVIRKRTVLGIALMLGIPSAVLLFYELVRKFHQTAET